MTNVRISPAMWRIKAALVAVLAVAVLSLPAAASGTAFKQAVAEAAAKDKDLSTFYRDTNYTGVWTGTSAADRARRAALLQALRGADAHGLPVERYALVDLERRIKSAQTARDLGQLDVEMSRVFLRYARDVQTGALIPSRVDEYIVRDVPYRDRATYLPNLMKSSPRGFFKALPPATPEYRALMKQKMVLEQKLARGGWGTSVTARKLEKGATGNSVVSLRDRLVRMGYLSRSASASFDDEMYEAVVAFQSDHGLAQDGVVGAGTLAEINVPVSARLQSVIVAMERERWLNKDRGTRHIEVNLADFTAKVIDNGKVTFETRSVVGARDKKRQSPEFSDQMEFMVINPSWFVPRSIATGEYLPELQQNPFAVNHLIITDSSGRQVNRASVDFTQYTAQSFPYAMRQPPSRSNALGLVKFMFPNKHNIYLHDTPAKNLFGREVRAYSHGCIRLADPFDFAYTLLARQVNDPKTFFQSQLATGREITVNLETPVPVHIIYRTALSGPKGRIQYRRDFYGRDGRIWAALAEAGVALQAVQG